MTRPLLAAIHATMILVLASAVRAQEAAQPSDPLILISYGPHDPTAPDAGQLAYMVSDLPAAIPRTPVSIRFWIFMEHYQGANSAFNTIARREQIDCAAGSLQVREVEYYKDGALVRRGTFERPPLTPSAGTVEATVIELTCNPSDRPGLRFSTPLTAREAVNERFHRMSPGE